MKNIKRYSREGLTVVWNPDICAHSAICARGLGEVFRPKEKPWINMQGASLAAIEAQVAQCPSGALKIEKGDLGVDQRENIREGGIFADTTNFNKFR
jgi:uncharacterized Fe-S cluster protein YjdI